MDIVPHCVHLLVRNLEAGLPSGVHQESQELLDLLGFEAGLVGIDCPSEVMQPTWTT